MMKMKLIFLAVIALTRCTLAVPVINKDKLKESYEILEKIQNDLIEITKDLNDENKVETRLDEAFKINDNHKQAAIDSDHIEEGDIMIHGNPDTSYHHFSDRKRAEEKNREHTKYEDALVQIEKRLNDKAEKAGDHIEEGDIMIHGNPDTSYHHFSDRKRAEVTNGENEWYRKWNFPISYRYLTHTKQVLIDDKEEILNPPDAANKAAWERALRMLNEKTDGCFTYQEVDASYHGKHLEIVSAGGCWSYVGDNIDFPEAQPLSLSSGCEYTSSAMHELFHALGFWHEQSRTDRDDYIEILRKNIEEGEELQFKKANADDVQDLGFPYDFESVMHYSSDAFAKECGLNTMIDKSGRRATFGRGFGEDALSAIDIGQFMELYDCPAPNNIK